MKKYFINLEFPKFLNGERQFVASSKATEDVAKLLLEQGYTYVPVKRNILNRHIGGLEFTVKMWWKLKCLPKGANVFIQYPMVNIKAFYLIAKGFRKHNASIIVHDLQSYRHVDINGEDARRKEIEILNCFKNVIVHSTAMKDRLSQDGVKTNMHVLVAFDYLLSSNQSIIKDKLGIVFAGALQKSAFLNEVYKIPQKFVHLNLYGAQKPTIKYTKSINYKGKFAPSNISKIEGDWGLMWDGEGIDTCKGKFGNYLHLIAPHKFSLYIACGLKIIIWEESAMAPLVKEKGLGIVINNLYEVEEKITSLTNEELTEIEKNVKEFSKQIRTGQMFLKALNQLL